VPLYRGYQLNKIMIKQIRKVYYLENRHINKVRKLSKELEETESAIIRMLINKHELGKSAK